MSSKHGLAVLMLSLVLSPAVQASCANANLVDNVPDGRYSMDGAEVTDTVTGLIWQRCSLGQSWDGGSGSCVPIPGSATTMTWAGALSAAEAEPGGDWRLPNLKELRSLVRRCVDHYYHDQPDFNATAFPDTLQNWYWTSTPYAANSGNSWIVHFGNGDDGTSYRNNNNHAVRLVRGGQ